jgi:signal transduction histidine kinase/ligand-binding sensor domain-containing protein
MNHTLTRRTFIWWLCCLCGLGLMNHAVGSGFDLAETAATLRLWHGPDGLPSDSVTAILQTRDGFLWVGTSAGLVRFDGITFSRIKLFDAATNSPVWITALCEDSAGALWIGSQQDGLFELTHGNIRRYVMADGLLDNGVTSLAADRQGRVWVGTQAGLNLWTGENFKSFTKSDGLADVFVSGVNVARSGTVWITTRSGMYRFVEGHILPYEFQTDSQGRSPDYLGVYEDRRGNLWAFGDTYLINLAEGKRFNYFRSSESASIRIWSLCEGRDGRLWIGTSGRGLFCFEGNSFQPVILGENHWSYDVRAICEDREGDLWLGTAGGGLVQLRPQSMQVVQAGQGLPAGLPTALAMDAHGRIYAGIRRAGLFAGESGGFQRVGGSGLAFEDFITSVWAGSDGAVWAGTAGNGLYGRRDGREIHLTTADGLADNAVLAVCGDRQGSVWAGAGPGTIYRIGTNGLECFGIRQGLPESSVTVMIPAAAGGLWLGMQDGQIFREKKGAFAGIETPLDWSHHPVLALQEGEADRLWIGTSGGGLSCLVKGALVNWNTSNGLPSDVVAGVAEDDAKNLWLVTGTGIYRVNRADLQEALYHPGVALPCTLMSDARVTAELAAAAGGTRVLLAPNGVLWLATSAGVLNVDTRQSEVAPPAFPVYIESAAVNGEPPVSLLRGPLWSPPNGPGPLFVPPQEVRSLVIHFTALSLTAPEDMQFRHKLEGSDPDWVNDAGARSVRYGRLPSGQYRFRVAARQAAGGWEEAGESFAFVVPTPLWRQTWALLLYGFAAVALVTGIVRIVSHRRLRFTLARLEQQQSLERERMRIARDMHDEMGSKLTKISFLSEHAQVDAQSGPLAGKIESIAQTSRDLLKTMDEIVWVVNPRNDTLENLTNYLSHYAVEYFQNTSIECELRLPPEIPHYPLSSEMRHNLFLTFEEALNNVLKHSEATSVQVEMTVKGWEFELKIMDNGKGFAAAPLAAPPVPPTGGRAGNGLKNMRQRLESFGGQCLITSQPGAGTIVTLRIRLSRATDRTL